jgi:hypothetical protein
MGDLPCVLVAHLDALQMMLYHSAHHLIGLDVEVVRGRTLSDLNLNMLETTLLHGTQPC